MRVEIDGLMFYRYVMPAIESNMYILLAGSSALIVDPNINREALKLLRESEVQKVTVLLTHEHFDHISGVNWLRDHFETEAICSEACAGLLGDPGSNMAKFWDIMVMDKPSKFQEAGNAVKDETYTCAADRTYEGEYSFQWQGHSVRMKQVPGHSRGGSLIWIDEKALFSGDNLVGGTGVICRLPGGNKRKYLDVTRPIFESLPDDFLILPGHGDPDKMAEMRPYLEFFGKTDRERQEAVLAEMAGETR